MDREPKHERPFCFCYAGGFHKQSQRILFISGHGNAGSRQLLCTLIVRVQERRLLILYGSQTGNAKEVAERVEQQAVRLHFTTELTFMDAYPKQKLPQESLVFFICSTTGQGDPPNNMKQFWRFLLRKDLPPNSLNNLSVAVFGLGDSGYPLYNAVARRFSQRLTDLGAQALCERGLGDDQHPKGYDGALDPWLAALWPKVD